MKFGFGVIGLFSACLRSYVESSGMKICLDSLSYLSQKVHVPNNKVLGFWVIAIMIQVLGKYMILGYLDP